MQAFADETREVDIAEQDQSKYADMDIGERAVAMADDGVGDPWELLGFFREKLRQAEVNAEDAKHAAIGYAQRLAALAQSSTTPVSEGVEVPDGWKLVPCEPTPDMIEAGRGMFPAPAYRKMVAAAKAPPSPSSEPVIAEGNKERWAQEDAGMIPWAYGWFDDGGGKHAVPHLPTFTTLRGVSSDAFPLYRLAQASPVTTGKREEHSLIQEALPCVDDIAFSDRKAADLADRIRAYLGAPPIQS